jgi:DedD protein
LEGAAGPHPDTRRSLVSWPRCPREGMGVLQLVGHAVNLRNLEDIQESDSAGSGFPLGTLFLAAVAGGALVVVVMMGLQRKVEPTTNGSDPLAELVEAAKKNPAPSALQVADKQVTFPHLLSDGNSPTTALAVVKDERGRIRVADDGQDLSEPEAPVAQPIDDRLPNRALPVGDLLSRTTVTEAPKDDLTQIAKQQTASGAGEAGLAPMGYEGGYEIQVASFREQKEADTFVEELRKRGHSAYRQAAHVPERGLWHRVRIGPFKTKFTAQQYQQKLEASERISTFLVDPDKMRRQEEIRDAKEKAREVKAERQRKRAEARLSAQR